MTHTSPPIRPARAAIAAVLALTATPLLAQEAPATAPVMPQPQAVQPASPAATAPTALPQVQMPTAQPASPAQATSLPGEPLPMAAPVVPPVASDIPVTSIAPPADIAEQTAPTPRTAPEPRRAVRTTTAAAPAAPVAITTPEPVADAPETAADIAPPVAAAAPAEPVETTAAEPSPAQTGEGDVWGWMAGLLALLGVGGGAIALRRTRTRKSARMSAPVATPHDAPVMHDSRLAGPHDRPVHGGMVTTAVPTPPVTRFDQPLMQAASQRAVQPPRSPTIRRTEELSIDERRLEQLIAQKPSRDNPFVTRANRKRRALFLLRNAGGMRTAA